MGMRGHLCAVSPATLQDLQRIRNETRTLSGAPAASGTAPQGLELEKSWHTLHYLLAGTVYEPGPAPGDAILGGREIGPDLGYGPARYLSPDQVRATAAALAQLTPAELARRFDLKTMREADIYCCEDESELALAQDYFVELADYYQKAAARGDAMLLAIL